MKFKCFSLHSIVDGEDIVEYSYGDVGYDLNPDSINTFAGSWHDLATTNSENKLINNEKFLKLKKIGLTYVDINGKVHETMDKKLRNRAKQFKQSIKENKKDKIFENNNPKDDDSFCNRNYTLEDGENKIFLETSVGQHNKYVLESNFFYNQKREPLTNDLKEKYKDFTGNEELPIKIGGDFRMIYDKEKGRVYTISGELLCTAKDPSNLIKVDRIFVLESKLQKLQDKQNGGGDYNGIYDRYINKLTDVLIEQFPFGEIRIVKGDVHKGQTNEFLSPEEFINQYFVNEKDKNDYLKKLNSKREEVKLKENNSKKKEEQNIKNGNDPNIKLEHRIEQPQQLAKEKKFKDILNRFNLIKEKLGEGEAKIDPKSKKNKIFLNDKWYDRVHWTETSIVKSQINKVFDSYVRGKINDEDAKRQLDNIVKSHGRFFNSIYCC